VPGSGSRVGELGCGKLRRDCRKGDGGWGVGRRRGGNPGLNPTGREGIAGKNTHVTQMPAACGAGPGNAGIPARDSAVARLARAGLRPGRGPKGPGIAGRNARVTQTRLHASRHVRSRSPDALLSRIGHSFAAASQVCNKRPSPQSAIALMAPQTPSAQDAFLGERFSTGAGPALGELFKKPLCAEGFTGLAAPWKRSRRPTSRGGSPGAGKVCVHARFSRQTRFARVLTRPTGVASEKRACTSAFPRQEGRRGRRPFLRFFQACFRKCGDWVAQLSRVVNPRIATRRVAPPDLEPCLLSQTLKRWAVRRRGLWWRRRRPGRSRPWRR
jgi:hypothetical protein